MAVDVVAAPSIRANGTVDQTPGYQLTSGDPGPGIPEIPATPTAQDIADVLVTLGLATQAA